jgi:hypothetical protein
VACRKQHEGATIGSIVFLEAEQSRPKRTPISCRWPYDPVSALGYLNDNARAPQSCLYAPSQGSCTDTTHPESHPVPLPGSAVQRRAECEQGIFHPIERKVRKRRPARPETNVWFICNPIRLAAACFTPRLAAAVRITVGLFAIRETLRTACHRSTSCTLVDRDVRNAPIAINGVLVQIRIRTRCTNVAHSLARSQPYNDDIDS